MNHNILLTLLLSIGIPVLSCAQEPAVPFVPLLWRTRIAQNGGVTQPDSSIKTMRLAMTQLELLQKSNASENTASQREQIDVIFEVLRLNEHELETFYAKLK